MIIFTFEEVIQILRFIVFNNPLLVFMMICPILWFSYRALIKLALVIKRNLGYDVKPDGDE